MNERSARPLLVLGGPGTGKTTLLESTFLRLVEEESILPHRILLLCSNRLYASGARDRLARALPQQAAVEIPVYTWHALAYHLVTRYYPELGFKELPILLTGPEQWGTVREMLDAEDPKDWPEWGTHLKERAFADEVADFCLRIGQRMMDAAQLDELAMAKPEWVEVIRFAGRYRSSLKARSRLDYAQLLASAHTLLSTSPAVASALNERFTHVLVDDGQDLGAGHLALLQQLAAGSLMVAADPDCGVEGFRGARPDWVFGFAGFFGPHDTKVLSHSHRIGAPLGPALLRLIEHNDSSSGHRPVPSDDGPATEFDCRQYASTVDEVSSIARELRRANLVDGIAWDQMAVLVSQPRYLLGPLQRALDLGGVPFQPILGDRPLASEPAVRCFLDLVRYTLAAGDAGRLLPDLLTSPLVGLDYTARRRLEREAWRTGRTLGEVVAASPEAGELRTLAALVAEHQDRAGDCFWQVYSSAPYYRALEERACADPSDPANTSIDALVDFSHSLERFVQRRGSASIADYLGEAARADFGADPWLPSSARSAPGVALSTFHGAKGRQWELVVVAGCLDAWIPKGKRAQGIFDPAALEIPDAAGRALEAVAEDRRTFYLAASRARRKVIFTVAPPNSSRNKPSRFLIEMAGSAPAPATPADVPPLNASEQRARLRRALAGAGASAGQRAAAVIALAGMPGTDPDRWYGRLAWSPGATPLVTGELRTSYSRLSVFENCGLQYVLQSVLGLDPSSTYSMRFGTWMHALFQAVHEAKITTPEALRTEYDKLFNASIFPNPTIARQFEKDGLKMLGVFWENEATSKNVVAEHSFEFSYEGAVLRGRIDRIDKKGGNALILTDYKTAKWAPSFTEAQESLQLAIYHLAARMDPELKAMGEPQLAKLVYPGAYRTDGRYYVLPQNADDAAKVIARLPELIGKVKDERFAPSPDADCHFCKMKLLCPLYPDGEELLV